jgi:hypothetical protein
LHFWGVTGFFEEVEGREESCEYVDIPDCSEPW